MHCPETDCAKPGDTIEIISAGRNLGLYFVVVPTPENNKADLEAGSVWVLDEYKIPRVVRFWECEIIKKLMSQEPRSVDDFLREQLNDNLDGIFG